MFTSLQAPLSPADVPFIMIGACHDQWTTNHRVHTHSLLRHWARRRQCIVLCVSLKRTKWNNTGDPFRSGVLKVMSLARLPLRHTGNMVGYCVLRPAWRVASVKLPKCNNTGDPFRSGVLGVMSPARFLCATPVKCVGVDEYFLHKLLIHIYI